MKYTIINLDEIPENLPPGEYAVEVVDASLEEIKVKFLGKLNDPTNPTLITMTKSDEVN